MRLLIADKLTLEPFEPLALLGVHLDYQPTLKGPELQAAAADCNILVVRSTKVDAACIDEAKMLNLIVRAGAGVNTIDVAAASARGIYVANCPGKNAAAVAELTMAHVLCSDRRLVDATVSLRQGRWEKAAFQRARGVMGRRLGVVGCGAIGRLVVQRAQAFGMEVHGWSRSLTRARAQQLGIGYQATLTGLAKQSDVLSIHLPLNDATRGMVGEEVLAALPDGALVINTSRAGVMDYEALERHATTRGLRAGLDVFPGEPKTGAADFTSTLMKLPGVYGTPHIGASTEQAQVAIATEASSIVRAFLTSEDVPNVVNVCRNTPARYALVLRAEDSVGVLANVFNVLKRHGLNIEECTNTVFDGAAAACTKLRLSARPGDTCLQEIRAFREVWHVDVVTLPNLA
jgi:D-3-phosphoglycerate dehydrogenase / 2-oxoglutarate reductase